MNAVQAQRVQAPAASANPESAVIFQSSDTGKNRTDTEKSTAASENNRLTKTHKMEIQTETANADGKRSQAQRQSSALQTPASRIEYPEKAQTILHIR